MVERVHADYKSDNTRYLLKNKQFGQQYVQLYASRLDGTKPILTTEAVNKWKCKVMSEISLAEIGKRCCIIGTLYKEMALKRSYLRELAEKTKDPIPNLPTPVIAVTANNKRYVSLGSDNLVVEDKTHRMSLIGDGIFVGKLVTGIPAAVLGVKGVDGSFKVMDLIFCPMKDPLPLTPPTPTLEKYVMLVSGLNISEQSNIDDLKLELLSQFINGCVGVTPNTKKIIASEICHMIIAGNLIHPSEESNDNSMVKYSTRNVPVRSIQLIRDADLYISRLVPNIPVSLMPGPNDPTGLLLPQQKLYRPMFPKSSLYQTFNPMTNPAKINIEGCTFLGTSGQNISDIYKHTIMDERLEILSKTLEWAHICPTAPDTLPCYPYCQFEDEPFLIKERPHVYFAGNQSDYCYKYTYKDTTCRTLEVLVPDFSLTATCVLVNIATLECKSICFDTSLTWSPERGSIIMES